MKKICVLGLGYIGLPTASILANKGYKVHGVDVSKKAVDTINRGEIHIVEPDLDILHVPHFNIPLTYKGRMVVTVHDLIYLLFADSVSNPMGKYYARFMIGQAMRKAEAVISVSRGIPSITAIRSSGRPMKPFHQPSSMGLRFKTRHPTPAVADWPVSAGAPHSTTSRSLTTMRFGAAASMRSIPG